MHGGQVCANAHKRLVYLKSKASSGKYNSFVNWRSGKVWRTTEEQRISTQVWRIPWEKININDMKREARRGRRSIHTRGVFYPHWDGKIHPCTDEPWNNGRHFN